MGQQRGMAPRGGGQRMGGQEILVELLAGTIAASLAEAQPAAAEQAQQQTQTQTQQTLPPANLIDF